MKNKKYEFTDETISIGTKTLHRIRALRDFNDVKKGELGGFVESDENLSHEGLAWVYNNARVSGKAAVSENAQIRDTAQVYDRTWVGDNALISGNAVVHGNTQVCSNARIFGNAQVDSAWIHGDARIYDNAQICDHVSIDGNARIGNDAKIRNGNDFLAIDNIGSRYDTTTFFKTSTGEIYVKCGCFYGSIDEFLSKVKTTHGTNKYGDEYRLACKLAEFHIHGAQND